MRLYLTDATEFHRIASVWICDIREKPKNVMKQYLIIAQDGKDEGALDRRKEVRPLHLAGARKIKENGKFLIGGAMLDEDSNMRGSIMIVQCDTQDDFQNWYDKEQYITSGVGKTIEVQTFRLADV